MDKRKDYNVSQKLGKNIHYVRLSPVFYSVANLIKIKKIFPEKIGVELFTIIQRHIRERRGGRRGTKAILLIISLPFTKGELPILTGKNVLCTFFFFIIKNSSGNKVLYHKRAALTLEI